MARKKGFGLGHLLIGLLVLGGIGQCLKSPSSTPGAPRTAISSPSVPTARPPALPAAAAPPAPQSVAAPLAATGRFYVTASTLNVRDAPSTSGRVLGKLSRGQQLAATGLQGDWLSVRLTDGRTGWLHSDYVSATPPPVRVLATPTPQPVEPKAVPSAQPRSQVVRLIIERSIQNYPGNCPCPYNVDRAGRRCGARSAYSKPGGASPICYEGDVTWQMVRAFVR